MSIATIFYTLLIGPLELFFEIVFMLANRVLQNPGLSIILLSLVVNFLVLPLYNRADEMQAAEREVEKRMEPGVRHIKKTFKGDEQFMMLQTYYRQNGYKPTDVLKGSVSLLLQVPFFIAAYNFLSGLQLLQGVSFGPIRDMGVPDAMFTVGGFSVNVLPILMTVLNIISGIIYTKGFPLKEKVQLYGMALIFLVLLYTSPAGLVFYWTLNNLFSLLKNIFLKLKNPKLVLSVIFSLTGLGLMGWIGFVRPMPTRRSQLLLLAVLALLQMPVLGTLTARGRSARTQAPISRTEQALFTGCSWFMTLLLGAAIPLAMLRTSPEEFFSLATQKNPLWYAMYAFLMAAGIFLVWLRIFYALAKPAARRSMALALWLLCGLSLVDYLGFGGDYGTLNPDLTFIDAPVFSVHSQLVNLAVLAAAAAVLLLVWHKGPKLARVACYSLLLGMAVMSCVDGLAVHADLSDTADKMQLVPAEEIGFPLSRDGKNVVIIMMDRAVSGYVPYMFNEKPELQQQFAGFTYYPNTMSFAPCTIAGLPAVFGGYEYTPEEMNKRPDELLEDKHAEALKVLPVLFSENGFETTVCDPTYAGYGWIPDLTIFDDYPQLHRYITMGRFDALSAEARVWKEEQVSRNFFCYSLFRAAPVFLQPTVYNDGLYNAGNAGAGAGKGMLTSPQHLTGTTVAEGQVPRFMEAYSSLQHLPDMTRPAEGGTNTFMMMCNDTSHEPVLLQEPEYEPRQYVDNTAYDASHKDRFTLNGRTLAMDNSVQIRHYQINMASMIQLGRWLDYLRAEDLYDNTRIILAADHGRGLEQFEGTIMGEARSPYTGEHLGDIMFYNPLLMVKDFGAQEFTTDDAFMTSADVPTLALADLVDRPVNPFTGKPITNEDKNKPEQHILSTMNTDTHINNGTTFIEDEWLAVHDNIFDVNNWSHLGVH